MGRINIRIVFYLFLVFIVSGCSKNISNKIAKEVQAQSTSVLENVIKAKLGVSRSLSPDFMCYNVNSTQVANWSDPNFTTAVNDLNPAILRIPGGDVGNYWNWQRGGLIENTNSLPTGLPFFLRFKARQYTASKLADFKAGLDGTNTEPIFVLNMLTSSLESQLQMLEAAADLGIEIKYVELGNEFYFNIPNYKTKFPNPRTYGLAAKTWTEAVKRKFPDAQVSVVGIVPTPDKPARLQNWNKVMRGTGLKTADAITLHIYNDHGLDSQPDQTNSYPDFTNEEAAIILGEPFRNWQNLLNDSNYQAIPNNKQIWITEYNLFEDIFQNGNEQPMPRVAGSWAHGLSNLATSLLFLEESRIESICNHSLTESSIFGAILNTSDSFVNPADENMQATPMSLSATGSALSLLGQATQEMTTATSIEMISETQLNGKDGFDYPAIYGWQFSNDMEKTAVVINLSNQDKTIDVSALFDSPSYQQLSGSPRALVNNSTVLTKTSDEATNPTNLIPLTAYSVTQISQ